MTCSRIRIISSGYARGGCEHDTELPPLLSESQQGEFRNSGGLGGERDGEAGLAQTLVRRYQRGQCIGRDHLVGAAH